MNWHCSLSSGAATSHAYEFNNSLNVSRSSVEFSLKFSFHRQLKWQTSAAILAQDSWPWIPKFPLDFRLEEFMPGTTVVQTREIQVQKDSFDRQSTVWAYLVISLGCIALAYTFLCFYLGFQTKGFCQKLRQIPEKLSPMKPQKLKEGPYSNHGPRRD